MALTKRKGSVSVWLWNGEEKPKFSARLGPYDKKKARCVGDEDDKEDVFVHFAECPSSDSFFGAARRAAVKLGVGRPESSPAKSPYDHSLYPPKSDGAFVLYDVASDRRPGPDGADLVFLGTFVYDASAKRIGDLLEEDDDFVSIFLAEKGAADPCEYLGRYDGDWGERSGGPSRAVADALKGFSKMKSYYDDAVAAAKKLGIAKTAQPFLLFRHRYRAKPGAMKYAEGVTFLGAFELESED